MPRGGGKAAVTKTVEPVKPVETEEQVDLDGENDAEEDSMEEEVEYEEVEEEIEEEVEEDEEEEEEAEEEEAVVGEHGVDDDMEDDEEEDREEHAELLGLPPHGSEVYVGNVPVDASEDDLKRFFEAIGEVVEVRLMKGKDSANSKRYAFITYRTKELASKAIKDLNNSELKGKKLRVSASQAKHRLFIGNVPRNWSEDDLKKVVMRAGPGATLLELKKDPQNSSRNRGFAFIEYYNQACAEYSRKKMSTPEFKLDSNSPTVSWADSKNNDSSSTSQVKALYVKNLPRNVTQEQVKELFKHHGEITKVVLPPAKPGQENSRFGFIHFAERSMAMKALKNTEKYELDGQIIECSLAKPPADNKKNETASSAQKSALLPAYPGRLGYGIVGPYGATVPAAYGASGFGQPVVYGRGAAPAGIAMMPMLLPDGRLGYVLQQAPHAASQQQHQQQQRGKSSASSRGRQSGDGKQGQRFRPY